MKRLISAILIVVLLASGIVVCAEGAKSITRLPGNAQMDVMGSYLLNADPTLLTAEPDDAGNYTIDFNGSKIQVDPAAPDSGKILAVRFFDDTDTSAMEWLKKEIEGLREDLLPPFEVFYLDAATGERYELGEEDVVSIRPVKDADAVLKRITYAGAVGDVAGAELKDGVLTFCPGGTKCYFALADREKKPSTPGGDEGQKPDSPDTGDHFNPIFWVAIMVCSGSALMLCFLLRKRKE